MWSDRTDRVDEQAATELGLHELIAMRPPWLRGPLAPGQRMPGGERSGRGRAPSLEFDGISPYVAGDDVRWIDWRATARSGKPQVRRFVAESHRGRMIVADLKADLRFGTQNRLMGKTVALVAAYLAWESLILHEPGGLCLQGSPAKAPRRGRRHMLTLLDALKAGYDAPNAGQDLGAAISDGSSCMRLGDELIVISDFAEPLDQIVEIGRAQSEMRRLRAIVVEDQLARQPLAAGAYPARDATTGARKVFRLGSRAASASVTIGNEARAHRVSRLRDGGWQVMDAHDLLPRDAGARR